MTRRVFLLLILALNLTACKLGKAQVASPRLTEIKKQIRQRKLTVDPGTIIPVDSVKNIKDTVIAKTQVISSNAEKLYLIKSDDGFWEWLKYGLSSVIALISVVYAYQAIKKERSNKHMDFLGEIDKLLIADPMLWAIYDIHIAKYPAESGKEQELAGKLDAFCYYHLNNFELVLLYMPSRKDARKTWKDYMVHLIVSSTRFREIVDNELEGYIYKASFKKDLIELRELAKKIQRDYDAYRGGSLSKAQYYSRAKAVLEN